MKKKSILLTCICALMALAMFVGCDQSVPFKYVTQYSVEAEDFLIGQTFEPSKVKVNITYSDGSHETKNAVINEVSAGVTDSTITGPITVSVLAGQNLYGEDLVTTAQLDVYSATGLTVTAPAETIEVEEASDSIALDPALFSVIATYVYGEMPIAATDYSVSVDASGIAAGETGTAIATVTFDNIEKEVEVTVTNTDTPPSPEDYAGYEWDGTSLAYSVVPMTSDGDFSYFMGSEFDGKAMLQLYKVRTQASNSATVYELIDSDAVEYTLVDYLDEDHKNNFANVEVVRVSAEYTYVKAEDEATGRKTILNNVGTVLTNLKETEVDGLYTATAANNDTYPGYLSINLMKDYIVGLVAERSVDTPFVVGNGASPADFVVTATYKSGNTAVLETSAYTVESKALALTDNVLTITLVNGTEEELYPDGVTETTAPILVVENYPTSIQLTANGYKKYGEAYSINDFTPSITWFKSVTYDEDNPAPVTISYTFDPVTAPEEGIGITNTVKFTWQCDQIPAVKGTGEVEIGVMDIPTSVTFTQTTDSLSANQPINDSKYSCNVTWASGKTGSDINGFTFDITQEYATGNVGEVIQLTGTWSCNGGFSGDVENSISVTLG